MKIPFHLTALAAVFVTLAAPISAHAAPTISVGSMYDFLEPGKSTLLKRVRNSGDATAFVRVSVHEIKFAEDGKQSEHDIDDSVMTKAGGHGLAASPSRLIVAAGGMQASRLLYRGDRHQERYYRLRFIPVLPTEKDDFAITEEERESYSQSLSAGVNLLAGYGTLLIVRPAQPKYQTTVNESPTAYTVSNQGNSTIVLDSVTDCNAAGLECTPATVHHIIPGMSKVFDAKAGRHYRFQLIEGTHSREMTVGR